MSHGSFSILKILKHLLDDLTGKVILDAGCGAGESKMTKTTTLLTVTNGKGFSISLEFCYKDLWFGIYWERTEKIRSYRGVAVSRFDTDVYFGVPFFVLHFQQLAV